MGVAEGVAVGDVLLPAAGLPVAVLLGEVFEVELSEGDGFGIVLIPTVELLNAVFIIVPCVRCRARTSMLRIMQMPTSKPIIPKV